MGRNRIKLKTSLVGSSDFRRFKSKVAILEMNHKKNLEFFESIKPSDKPIPITEEYLLRRYKEVRVLGTWRPLYKYIGCLKVLYDDKYLMR
jgi:hypothetical protein